MWSPLSLSLGTLMLTVSALGCHAQAEVCQPARASPRQPAPARASPSACACCRASSLVNINIAFFTLFTLSLIIGDGAAPSLPPPLPPLEPFSPPPHLPSPPPLPPLEPFSPPPHLPSPPCRNAA